MKNKLSGRFWCALTLFSLIGQVAWVVENMYFNVFIYKMFAASAGDISNMVAASAVAATLTTVFMGALSDRVGKRKLFICGGYILWGISIVSFALIRIDIIEAWFPMAVSAASVGVSLVIIMDCIMTFFGSTANDAAFNAWVTDSTDNTNRGAAEGINSMMPLVAILVVFGGFMAFDLDKRESWTLIFIIIGVIVLAIGILGVFIIKEPSIRPTETGCLKNITYGFLPSTISRNRELYVSFAAFVIFNTSIQIFMPYLIIYYEVSLQMTNYVLIMAPAIIIASVVTALWGKVYDKKGFVFTSLISSAWLSVGYVMLYLFRNTALVFVGSLFMMSGYLSSMAVFGAKIRDKTPGGKSGMFQGMRIFSQVLIPGVVGPYIGKTVLKNAETIVGNDGTESFVPNANIFAAALVPIIVLIPIIIQISKMKKIHINKLKTDFEIGDIPHNYYPRPQMKRDSFVNLNGKWKFSVVSKKGEEDLGNILVPFPPESVASGIERITKKNETLIYERSFDAEKKGRVLLHFGAVDCICEVFINDKKVGGHEGGYLPFTIDITKFVYDGENNIRVLVKDSLSHDYAYGKQKYKRGGMWYTPVSGIWQTVWIENVPEKYIESIKITPSMTSVTIETVGGETEKTIILHDKEYSYSGDKITIEVDEAKLWTPDSPYLYDFMIKSGEDEISSYFALRTMSIEEKNGRSYMCLNGKPYFFHGLLDQGYYPEGIYTVVNGEGYLDDILKMKELGFNMLRKHIKIEPEIFYYYCDKYGMAVFQDMVNNGSYNYILDTVLPTIGIKKGLCRPVSNKSNKVFLSDSEATADMLYNHPSVLYYTIFNEGWGQHNSTEIYRKLKMKDRTRVWDTASGWFKGYESDVQSEHVYFKPVKFEGEKGHPMVLSEFGGYSYKINDNSYNLDKTYGYKSCKNKEEFTSDLEKLYLYEIVPMIEKGLNATVLTQISDVEDETNGLVTYDRKIVKPDVSRMKSISNNLYETFEKSFGD